MVEAGQECRVRELASRLVVGETTVRRDLDALAEEGRIIPTLHWVDVASK